jgi:hypothetical protein
LSTEQRTRIRTTVFAGNNVPRVNNVNFSVSVGTADPATVRLVEAPPTLIEIYPAWRGHQYFVVRDEIVIVDRDRRIISVVPVGTGDAAQSDSRERDRSAGGSMSVEEIRRVQLILKERGFAVEVDGILGPQTRQAIMTYQRQQGIQVTGEIDQRTSTSLGVTSAGRDQPGNQDRSDGDRDRPGQRPTANQQGNQQGGQPASTGQGDDRATPRTNPPGSDAQRGNNAPDNARDGATNNRPADRSPSPSR